MRLGKTLGRRGKLVLWFALVALFFLVMALAVYGVFALIVSPSSDKGTILYKWGTGSRRDASYEVARADYCPDGVPYVDMTSLAEACGFSISGDEGEIRYLIPVEKNQIDSVTFHYGSRKIMVNDNYYMLASPVKKVDGKLLVPAEFVTVCMEGVTVEVDRNSIVLVYNADEIALKPDLRPIAPINP